MKFRYLLPTVLLTLTAGIVYGGHVDSVPVRVDLTAGQATGDLRSARTSPDTIAFIGCGSRTTEAGPGNAFHFGFCQAGDAEGNTIICSTENAELLKEIQSIGWADYIIFRWTDDGSGAATCSYIGTSKQSVYLPAS